MSKVSLDRRKGTWVSPFPGVEARDRARIHSFKLMRPRLMALVSAKRASEWWTLGGSGSGSGSNRVG